MDNVRKKGLRLFAVTLMAVANLFFLSIQVPAQEPPEEYCPLGNGGYDCYADTCPGHHGPFQCCLNGGVYCS